MKKSKYVTKYDYINYFVKQPSMWFFKNSEIEAKYKSEYEYYSKLKKKSIVVDDELDEEDEYEDEPIDSYNLYREYLEELYDVDTKNYLMVQGNIIDRTCKQFIYDSYKNEYEYLIKEKFIKHDFDDYKITLEENANQTLQLIHENKYIIIFQPAFINHELKIATKCDSLVKIDNDIFIIETKGTSTAKYHHILDLMFQKKVIEHVLNDDYSLSYKLCLVKYEKLMKKKISYIISDTINLKKSVSISKNKKNLDIESKQQLKIGGKYSYTKNNGEIVNVDECLIDDVLNLNFDAIHHLKDEAKDTIIDLNDNFKNVINQLWNVKNQLNDDSVPNGFEPNSNDKNKFKDTDMWAQLRKLYYVKGYDIFKYSGNVIDFNQSNLQKIYELGKNKQYDVEPFLRYINNKNPLSAEKNKKRFLLNNEDFVINKERFNNLLIKIKPKKVYFDFESINPAIRVVDNSLPFTQVITQNSYIIQNDENIDNLVCNNMMIDPNEIDVNWFKKIIDALYMGEEYSYIVYNKHFESNRLIEMSNFIREDEYYNKVSTINKNIFDLADFFMLNSKQNDACLIKELNGFYSIKNILPLIQKYEPKIFKKTKCKDYKELNIGNGLVCQEKTMNRFFGITSDEEWDQVVKESKIYCENDVRAMIAVELFIRDFLSNK